VRRQFLETQINDTSTEPNFLTIQEIDELQGGQNNSTPKHGDVVESDDGVAELVVDRFHERDKTLQQDKRTQSLLRLADREDTTFESLKEVNSDTVDRGMLVVKKDPHSQSALKIMEVKRAFANYSVGAKGLVEKDSEDAKKFELLMSAVRSGRVVLPTVEEYEAQKKAEQERMKNNIQEDTIMTELKTERQNPRNNPPTKTEAPVQPTELPVNRVPKTQQAPIPKDASVKKAEPINLARMQAEKKDKVEQTSQMIAPPVVPPTVTEFKVPAEKAEVFYSTLTTEQKSKVTRSDTIVINEIQEVDVPTATKSIDDLGEYKRVVPRAVSGEFVEIPLPNSGYIATMYGCSDMEMAAIMVDPDATEIDYAKRYQFCYDQLKTTSIGFLSYQEFVRYTSPRDLVGMIWAIYRASTPSEESMTLSCGNPNCKKPYDVTMKLDDMVDYESLSPETIEMINKLIEVRDDVDAAIALRKESPASKVKYMKIGDRTWCIKAPDGPTTISHVKVINKIADQYKLPQIPLLLIYIREVYVYLDVTDAGKTEPFKITNPEIIAKELARLDTASMNQLYTIVNNITEYDPYQFKLKGTIKCPHCGKEEHDLAVDVDDLVFQKVVRTMNIG